MMDAPPGGITDCGAREEILWDDSRARSAYADVFNVTTSGKDVCLLFGTSRIGKSDKGAIEADLTHSIVLGPLSAKHLAVQLNHAIQEHESKYGLQGAGSDPPPSPLKTGPQGIKPPVFDGREKARALFGAIKTLNVPMGFERSFKIFDGSLLSNRFLLGLSKVSIKGNADEKLIELCGSIGMPESLLAVFKQSLPKGNYIHFGFEQDQKGAVYKVYLEFWKEIQAGFKRSLQRPGLSLLHIGLKWDVSDPARNALTRYVWHPWLLPGEIMERVSEALGMDKNAPPKQAAQDLLSVAIARVPPHDVLYLDVSEEGNPRRSFDINVYRANLLVEEIYPLLSVLCRRFSIRYDSFHTLYERIKKMRLGHLAGGIDREGKGFFSIYYGVEGIQAAIPEPSPSPPKLHPVQPEKTDEKGSLLFNLVKSLEQRESIEHSFKFREGVVLPERFLVGFKRSSGDVGQKDQNDERILEICRRLDMPGEFHAQFQSQLHDADVVFFASEKDEKTNIYKAYLEFYGRLTKAEKRGSGTEGVALFTGFKWDAFDNTRKARADYTAYPGLGAREVTLRVLKHFYRGERSQSYRIVDDILDLAGSRTQSGELLFLEVTEENNPRNSFDVNVYAAGLRVAEIYPLLVKIAVNYSIDLKYLNGLYENLREKKFGHLSGGTDREGRDFLTVYFSKKGMGRYVSVKDRG